jgi:predicted transcriptional regulator
MKTNIEALKIDLIHWLTELKDVEILKQLQAIKEGRDWWEEIGQAERQAIEEGLAQLERGETIPHEQVKEKIRSRFKQ